MPSDATLPTADRPWLARYNPGMPADIPLAGVRRDGGGFANALEMFTESVAAGGDRPSVHYFSRTLTLADVDRASDALAAALVAHGFRGGDRLAVYLQNVPQYVVTVLATWKAGGIVVPVNPMSKARELTYALDDSGSTFLVALESLYHDVARDVVADRGARCTVITTNELDLLDPGAPVPAVLRSSTRQRPADTLDLVELATAFDGQAVEPPTLALSDIAFLTYTSGTTGPPKGAMNTHGNVVFNAESYRTWMSLTPDDVVLGVAPLFHITGLIAHVAVALLVPMPIVLGYRFDPATTLDLIEAWRPTFTVGAITVFVALMNDASWPGRDLSSLTKVYSGGAPIAPSVVERFETEAGAYIHNIYGLTETTSPSHGVPMGARSPVDPVSGALSVGVPIFNTVVRVIDDDGNDVAPGEVGELVTSGPQVVAGYWNKPEETAHALPGGSLHTGDVGFMDAEGWFYVVDRKKDMIIAAGYKVWPREVEDVLYQHPAVREAGVIGVPDEYRGETVKAFVSLRADMSVTEQELIAFCKERMAAYKYPRSIEFVDELPKTVTGKILRRNLRAQPTA
jgi:long-chain acyl-CoA synthetase